MPAILPILNTLPVDKSVAVVAKKCNEANDHGQVGKGLDRGKHPKPDEDNIVCGVRKRIIAAAQKEEGCGEETRHDGNRTQIQIRRSQSSKYEEENHRYYQRHE